MKSKKSSSSTRSSKSTPPAAAAQPPASAPSTPPTRDQIQALAHAFWKDRGCPPDSDVEIWLEAERQLTGGTRGTTGATGSSQRLPPGESVDPDQSDAGRIDREMDRVVRPPEQRSPTSL